MKNQTEPDLTPVGYPPKDGVLFLLGLNRDATKDEFISAWNEMVAPAQNGEWAKTHFNRYIEKLQREKNLTFQQAWALSAQLPEGQRLGAAYRAEAEAKKR
jgi:hypothetical protein